jgi:LytS/YehU family sensor histidine kinase
LEENERIFIPLNREMELIKNYLTVQKLRLDESFEFGISVDKNALESPIPNNILLPIIEYLVNQSLSQRTDKNGSISIDCKKGEKSLDISIAHNGPTPIGIDYKSNTISSIPQGLKTLKQLLTLYFYKFNVSIELHTRVLKIKGESFQVQDIKIFEND